GSRVFRGARTLRQLATPKEQLAVYVILILLCEI
ncbi:MAG: hypothetical protein ACI90G_002250, partial [Urechidicola sp.]